MGGSRRELMRLAQRLGRSCRLPRSRRRLRPRERVPSTANTDRRGAPSGAPLPPTPRGRSRGGESRWRQRGRGAPRLSGAASIPWPAFAASRAASMRPRSRAAVASGSSGSRRARASRASSTSATVPYMTNLASHSAVGGTRECPLGETCRLGPLTEREMGLGGGAIEEPSMQGIYWSRFGLREQSMGAVAVASARREDGAGHREAQLTQRKRLGAFAVIEDRVGLRPAAESSERLRRETRRGSRRNCGRAPSVARRPQRRASR